MRKNGFRSSRKHFYLLLIFGILFSITIRFAFMPPHETGTDTWIYHRMINALLDLGYAPWFIHPLAYFGVFPFSDSSGILILIGTVAEITGISVEISTLIFSLLTGLTLFMDGFLVSLFIKRDGFFATIAGISFTFAPILFYDTLWTISPRVMAAAIIPFILMLLMKAYEKGTNRILFIMLALLMTGTSILIHKLSIFIATFFIAFAILWAGKKFNNIMLWAGKKFNNIMLQGNVLMQRLLLIAASFGMMISMFFLSSYLGISIYESYQTGAFFTGSSIQVLVINLGISIVGGTGLLFLLFGIIGILTLIWKPRRSFQENYFLACILSLFPFILVRTYVRVFLPIILTIPIAIGIFVIIRKIKNIKRKTVVSCLIAGIVVLSAPGFAFVMTTYWREKNPETAPITPPSSVLETAIYLSNDARYQNYTFVSQNPLIGDQIASYTNWIDLPSYYSTSNWFGLYYGYYKKEDIRPEWNGLGSYFYFSDLEGSGGRDYLNMMFNSATSVKARDTIQKYKILYVVEDKMLNDNIPGWYWQGVSPSNYLKTIGQTNYSIYENSRVIIWLV